MWISRIYGKLSRVSRSGVSFPDVVNLCRATESGSGARMELEAVVTMEKMLEFLRAQDVRACAMCWLTGESTLAVAFSVAGTLSALS